MDLILSLDHSAVENISASGIALLGAHEDIAEARVEFASGLIANLRASRMATQATRRMQLYTTECYADIDFSAESVQIIKPSSDVLARCVALDELPDDERLRAKDRIFDNLLHCESLAAPGRNAILDEQNDFALSIRTGASPAVSGADGARAIEVASRIVDTIREHGWDGQHSKPWRVGTQATLEPRIIPMQGTQTAAEAPSLPIRRAG